MPGGGHRFSRAERSWVNVRCEFRRGGPGNRAHGCQKKPREMRALARLSQERSLVLWTVSGHQRRALAGPRRSHARLNVGCSLERRPLHPRHWVIASVNCWLDCCRFHLRRRVRRSADCSLGRQPCHGQCCGIASVSSLPARSGFPLCSSVMRNVGQLLRHRPSRRGRRASLSVAHLLAHRPSRRGHRVSVEHLLGHRPSRRCRRVSVEHLLGHRPSRRCRRATLSVVHLLEHRARLHPPDRAPQLAAHLLGRRPRLHHLDRALRSVDHLLGSEPSHLRHFAPVGRPLWQLDQTPHRAMVRLECSGAHLLRSTVVRRSHQQRPRARPPQPQRLRFVAERIHRSTVVADCQALVRSALAAAQAAHRQSCRPLHSTCALRSAGAQPHLLLRPARCEVTDARAPSPLPPLQATHHRAIRPTRACGHPRLTPSRSSPHAGSLSAFWL